MGIPAGPNKARRIAVAVGKAAFRLGSANLTLYFGPPAQRIHKFWKLWKVATGTLSEAALACAQQ